MQKKYQYIVRFRKISFWGNAIYSRLLWLDTPISTKADEEMVKKLIRRKNPFAKCLFMSYELVKCPYEEYSALAKQVHEVQRF